MNDVVTYDLYRNVLRNIKKCLPSNISQYSVHEPNLSIKVKKELNKCLSSTHVSSSGKYIDKFSESLKDIIGSKYILLTNSGTSALFCAFNEIDIKNGVNPKKAEEKRTLAKKFPLDIDNKTLSREAQELHESIRKHLTFA